MTAAVHYLLDSVQDQDTALMMAAWKGCLGIVRMLIQHGADVNLKNKVSGPHACLMCVTPGTYTLVYIHGSHSTPDNGM